MELERCRLMLTASTDISTQLTNVAQRLQTSFQEISHTLQNELHSLSTEATALQNKISELNQELHTKESELLQGVAEETVQHMSLENTKVSHNATEEVSFLETIALANLTAPVTYQAPPPSAFYCKELLTHCVEASKRELIIANNTLLTDFAQSLLSPILLKNKADPNWTRVWLGKLEFINRNVALLDSSAKDMLMALDMVSCLEDQKTVESRTKTVDNSFKVMQQVYLQLLKAVFQSLKSNAALTLIAPDNISVMQVWNCGLQPQFKYPHWLPIVGPLKQSYTSLDTLLTEYGCRYQAGRALEISKLVELLTGYLGVVKAIATGDEPPQRLLDGSMHCFYDSVVKSMITWSRNAKVIPSATLLDLILQLHKDMTFINEDIDIWADLQLLASLISKHKTVFNVEAIPELKVELQKLRTDSTLNNQNAKVKISSDAVEVMLLNVLLNRANLEDLAIGAYGISADEHQVLQANAANKPDIPMLSVTHLNARLSQPCANPAPLNLFQAVCEENDIWLAAHGKQFLQDFIYLFENAICSSPSIASDLYHKLVQVSLSVLGVNSFRKLENFVSEVVEMHLAQSLCRAEGLSAVEVQQLLISTLNLRIQSIATESLLDQMKVKKAFYDTMANAAFKDVPGKLQAIAMRTLTSKVYHGTDPFGVPPSDVTKLVNCAANATNIECFDLFFLHLSIDETKAIISDNNNTQEGNIKPTTTAPPQINTFAKFLQEVDSYTLQGPLLVEIKRVKQQMQVEGQRAQWMKDLLDSTDAAAFINTSSQVYIGISATVKSDEILPTWSRFIKQALIRMIEYKDKLFMQSTLYAAITPKVLATKSYLMEIRNITADLFSFEEVVRDCKWTILETIYEEMLLDSRLDSEVDIPTRKLREKRHAAYLHFIQKAKAAATIDKLSIQNTIAGLVNMAIEVGPTLLSFKTLQCIETLQQTYFVANKECQAKSPKDAEEALVNLFASLEQGLYSHVVVNFKSMLQKVDLSKVNAAAEGEESDDLDYFCHAISKLNNWRKDQNYLLGDLLRTMREMVQSVTFLGTWQKLALIKVKRVEDLMIELQGKASYQSEFSDDVINLIVEIRQCINSILSYQIEEIVSVLNATQVAKYQQIEQYRDVIAAHYQACIGEKSKGQFRVSFMQRLLQLLLDSQSSDIDTAEAFFQRISEQVTETKATKEIENIVISNVNNTALKTRLPSLHEAYPEIMQASKFSSVDHVFHFLFEQNACIAQQLVLALSKQTDVSNIQMFATIIGDLCSTMFFESLEQQEKIQQLRLEMLQVATKHFEDRPEEDAAASRKAEEVLHTIDQLNGCLINACFNVVEPSQYSSDDEDSSAASSPHFVTDKDSIAKVFVNAMVSNVSYVKIMEEMISELNALKDSSTPKAKEVSDMKTAVREVFESLQLPIVATSCAIKTAMSVLNNLYKHSPEKGTEPNNVHKLTAEERRTVVTLLHLYSSKQNKGFKSYLMSYVMSKWSNWVEGWLADKLKELWKEHGKEMESAEEASEEEAKGTERPYDLKNFVVDITLKFQNLQDISSVGLRLSFGASLYDLLSSTSLPSTLHEIDTAMRQALVTTCPSVGLNMVHMVANIKNTIEQKRSLDELLMVFVTYVSMVTEHGLGRTEALELLKFALHKTANFCNFSEMVILLTVVIRWCPLPTDTAVPHYNEVLVDRVVSQISDHGKQLLLRDTLPGDQAVASLLSLCQLWLQLQQLANQQKECTLVGVPLCSERTTWILLLTEAECVFADKLSDKECWESISCKLPCLWYDVLSSSWYMKQFHSMLEVVRADLMELCELSTIAQEEKKEEYKFPAVLNSLVEATKFDEISKHANELRLLSADCITNFRSIMQGIDQLELVKMSLVATIHANEPGVVSRWLEALVAVFQKTSDTMSTSEMLHIMKFAHLVGNLTFVLETIEQQIPSIKEAAELTAMLYTAAAAALIDELCDHKEVVTQKFSTLINRLIAVRADSDAAEVFAFQFLIALQKCVMNQVKLRPMEASALKDAIKLAVHLRIFDRTEGFNEQLSTCGLLQWSAIIEKQRLKIILGTEDNLLINDICFVQRDRGKVLTESLLQLMIKHSLSLETTRNIIVNVKKHVWDINNEVIGQLESILPTEWIALFEEIRLKSNEPFTQQQLVDDMKSYVNNGEINFSIRQLLEDRKDAESVITDCVLIACLKKVEQQLTSPSLLNKDCSTLIQAYNKEDILVWKKVFVSLGKESIDSIEHPMIIELLAVISQGIKCCEGHNLRSTQIIAVLTFLDSMLFRKFSGRIAEVSTGEGKTFIVISSAVAKLMLFGGTVDILSSSEVLAERDANENKHIYQFFDFQVGNNCDDEAVANEQTRQRRYDTCSVIYGDVGSFQRDILLTKYYDKRIRNRLANCLIVDEADSMCIDNTCNTLYISHPVPDLRYLRDLYVVIWKAIHDADYEEYSLLNTRKIQDYIEKLIDEGQINYPKYLDGFVRRGLKRRIENAYVAKLYMTENNQYSVLRNGKRTGEAIINDLQTGVEQVNTQWSEGLHQFIQLKHLSRLTDESLKAIYMSNYLFFKQYHGDIYGMTGTLGSTLERELLGGIYGIDFFKVPRFKCERNIRELSLVCTNPNDWKVAVGDEIQDLLYLEEDSKLIDQEDHSCGIDSLKRELTSMQDDLKKMQEEYSKKLLSVRGHLSNFNSVNASRENDLLKDKAGIDSKQIERVKKTFVLEDLQDGGSHYFRGMLLICESKGEVEDLANHIWESGLVVRGFIYTYKGKLDGLRRMEGKGDKGRLISIECMQVRPGDIIVATNVAGRGSDFAISEVLRARGGLHVLVTFLPPNVRVELQAFGRSGRKGDPGSGRAIVWDSRAVHGMDYDSLISERDQKEADRLHQMRTVLIPRVELEGKLFDKFSELLESVFPPASTNILTAMFTSKDTFPPKDIQRKALFNKWAFWLEEMTGLLQTTQTLESQFKLFQEYQKFEASIKAKLKHKFGLVESIGELVELAKYCIASKKFYVACSVCNAIESHGTSFASFAYYYKAMAIFQPIVGEHSNQFTKSMSIGYLRHEIDYHERVAGMRLLKKAIKLFESEIAAIEARIAIMSAVLMQSSSSSSVDSSYFWKNCEGEIKILSQFGESAKAGLTVALSEERFSKCFTSTLMPEDATKAMYQQLFELMGTKKLIKKDRLSKKLLICWHVQCPKQELVKAAGNVVIPNDLTESTRGLVANEFYCSALPAALKDNLRNNEIKFQLELLAKSQISGKYEQVQIPRQFSYCTETLLDSMQKLLTQQETLPKREQFVKEYFNGAEPNPIFVSKHMLLTLLTNNKLANRVKSRKLSSTVTTAMTAADWTIEGAFPQGCATADLKIKLQTLVTERLQKSFWVTEEELSSCIGTSVDPQVVTQVLEGLLNMGILESTTPQDNYIFEKAIAAQLTATIDKIEFYSDSVDLIVKSLDLSSYVLLSRIQKQLNKRLVEEKKKQAAKSDVPLATATISIAKKDILALLAKACIRNHDTLDQKIALGGKLFDQAFDILKITLCTSGYAKCLLDYLTIDLTAVGLDNTKRYHPSSQEFQKKQLINVVVESVHDVCFDSNALNLPASDDLLTFLKAEKVIKSACVNQKLHRHIDKEAIEAWEKELQEQASSSVVKVIDKLIADDKFVSNEEVEERYDSWVSQLANIHTAMDVNQWPAAAMQMALDHFPDKVGKTINVHGDQSKEFAKLLLGNKDKVYPEYKAAAIKEKKEKQEKALKESAARYFVDSVGYLKRSRVCTVTCNSLQDCFVQMHETPKEITEYALIHRDQVLCFLEVPPKWSWTQLSIILLGVLQIAAGVALMIWPIFGPFLYNIGSALISEGAGDIIFALQSGGGVTWESYRSHKAMSLVITAVAMGVGCLLSAGASVVASGGNSLWPLFFKMVAAETGKAFLGVMTSILVQTMSEYATQIIFAALYDKLIWLMKQNKHYVTGMVKVKENSGLLYDELQQYHSGAELAEQVEDVLQDTEQNLRGSWNNVCAQYVNQVGGGLCKQINTSMSAVKYVGDRPGALSQTYGKVGEAIQTAMTVVKVANTTLEMKSVVEKSLRKISSKLATKKEYFTEKRVITTSTSSTSSNGGATVIPVSSDPIAISTSSSSTPTPAPVSIPAPVTIVSSTSSSSSTAQTNVEASSEQDEDTSTRTYEIRKAVDSVDRSLMENIRALVTNNIVNPAFTNMLDYALKPVYEWIDSCYKEEFQKHQEKALLRGEYNQINQRDSTVKAFNNEEDEDNTEGMFRKERKKEYIEEELSNHGIPVEKKDLSELLASQEGETAPKYKYYVNGKLQESSDFDTIADHLGTKGIRVIRGPPDVLVRPTLHDQIQNFDANCKAQAFHIHAMAASFKTRIVVHSKDAEGNMTSQSFGRRDGEGVAVEMYLENGHYMPFDAETQQPVGGVANENEACAMEAFQFQQLRELGLSKEQANYQLNQDRSQIEDGYKQVRHTMMHDPAVAKFYLSRQHEGSGLLGGCRQYPDSGGVPISLFKEKKDKTLLNGIIDRLQAEYRKFFDYDELSTKLQQKADESKRGWPISPMTSADRHNNDKKMVPKKGVMVGMFTFHHSDGTTTNIFTISGDRPLALWETAEGEVPFQYSPVQGGRNNVFILVNEGFDRELEVHFLKDPTKSTGQKYNKSCAAQKAWQYVQRLDKPVTHIQMREQWCDFTFGDNNRTYSHGKQVDSCEEFCVPVLLRSTDNPPTRYTQT